MLRKIGKAIETAEEAFCVAAFLVVSGVLFVNVVLRYAFSASTSWAEELIRYLMIWITFIGGCVCVRRGAHIRMDFIMTMMPRQVGLWLTRLVYVLAAAFCAALCWYGTRLMIFTVARGQTTPAMGLPMWLPYAAMPLGSALMALHFLQELFRKEADAE
ncbi:MAG: TRAP transporter small permease [Fretibacterium sp.]|nr:TRAP transporter small permease [Fretibacterium sp.]